MAGYSPMASKLLLLLAAVGGARAFSSMPDKVPTRMTYSSNDDQNLRCIGSGGLLWPTDSSTWTDSWEDGCDWYAVHDPGCSTFVDEGQTEACPIACKTIPQKCVCDDDKVLLDGACESTAPSPPPNPPDLWRHALTVAATPTASGYSCGSGQYKQFDVWLSLIHI